MDTSAIISGHKQAILDRWIAKVKEEIPEARNHKKPLLKNSVPHLLDALVDALRSDDARDVVYRSGEHGKERARLTSFSLVQVIREYRLLKETIFSVLDEKGDDIKMRERDGIMYAIDQAAEQATNVFYEERTRELKEAKERAEELSDKLKEQGVFRDRFVATLTHDLRSPLNNTLQLIDLMKDKTPDQKGDFFTNILGKIELSVSKGNKLISNLLDVNNIQSGEPLPLNWNKTNLLQSIKNTVDSYQTDTKDRIVIKSERQEVIDCWDQDALTRAIDNLISNAIKYGEDKSLVTIELLQGNSNTTISVHNYGNPIAPEKLEKLFDLYYRTGEVKGKTGWGLGLTLVQGVAKAHNGQVEVKSSSEDGTTFKITIPRQLEKCT